MSLEYLQAPIDIGQGVTIVGVLYKGQVVGINEEHNDQSGARCSGYVRFRIPTNDTTNRPSWVIEAEEPLTLSPSILCTTCGHHGWIRDGKWVSAP